MKTRFRVRIPGWGTLPERCATLVVVLSTILFLIYFKRLEPVTVGGRTTLELVLFGYVVPRWLGILSLVLLVVAFSSVAYALLVRLDPPVKYVRTRTPPWPPGPARPPANEMSAEQVLACEPLQMIHYLVIDGADWEADDAAYQQLKEDWVREAPDTALGRLIEVVATHVPNAYGDDDHEALSLMWRAYEVRGIPTRDEMVEFAERARYEELQLWLED